MRRIGRNMSTGGISVGRCTAMGYPIIRAAQRDAHVVDERSDRSRRRASRITAGIHWRIPSPRRTRGTGGRHKRNGRVGNIVWCVLA